MKKTASRKMLYTAIGLFLSLCIRIKADPVGQVPTNPFAPMSIQQIEQEFPVTFVTALRSGTGTPATGTITPPPPSEGMNQIPWNPPTTWINWVFQEKFPLARPHTLDIPLMVKVHESPSLMEFTSAMIAVDDEARYLSEHNLLPVAPPVQERKTDP